MTVDPGQMVPQNHPLETPDAVVVVPRHGFRPAAATHRRGVVAVAGSTFVPFCKSELDGPELVVGDECLVGVAVYVVAGFDERGGPVLEGPINKRADSGGLW